jgi:hypothetical protein
MHAIPATEVYKLNSFGEYVNGKGLGRPQAISSFTLGSGYVVEPASSRSLTVFLAYQQRLQFPFVKSYVPMLPYNSMFAGASIKLKKQHH